MSGSRTFVAAIACTSLLSSLPLSDEGRAAAQPTASPSPTDLADLIDRHVTAGWKQAGVTPAPRLGDHAFIRRVTLDLAGRIPSVGEVEAFVADRSPGKRAALVRRLTASEDYAHRFADLYMDLMIGRELRFRPRFAAAPADYFVASFRDNKPFDRLASELITATGDLDDNGAAGYVTAQRLRGGSIETLAGTTARNFLGVQIQCAQCHDHPTDDRYDRDDFVRFAAYFAGTRARRRNDPLLGPTLEVAEIARLPYSPPPRVIERRADRFPYIVEPRFFGRATPPRPGESRRQVLARTIVGSELFAKVTVNRTWAQLVGRAIVEPWDDLGGEGDPRHPPLLDQLADDFRSRGYDHRRLVEAIVLSKAYQRASHGGGGADADELERRFARAPVRPLSASQLFYSQLLVTGVEEAARGMKAWQIERRVERALREYLFTFGDDDGGTGRDSFTGSVPQALLVRNGVLSNQGTRAANRLVLDRILRASGDRDQRLSWLVLAAYAREPTDRERQLFTDFLDRNARNAAGEREAYADLFHALVTSTEFLTNH